VPMSGIVVRLPTSEFIEHVEAREVHPASVYDGPSISFPMSVSL
jgi:hypothetical protein